MQPARALWLNGVAVPRAVSPATSTSGLRVCFENVLFISSSWSEHPWAVTPVCLVLQLSHPECIPMQTSSPGLSEMPSLEPRATAQVSSLPAMRDA